MSQVFTPASKATIPYDKPSMFLGGSIEMGKAYPWQEYAIELFQKEDFVILNPRRPDWNNTWTQSAGDPQFNHQVNWELDGIDRADCVVMFFDENTMSPISMMELGYLAGKVHMGDLNKTVVHCRDSFWRKGNVDIISGRNHIQVFDYVDARLFWEEAKNIMLRNHDRRTNPGNIW